MLKTERSSRLRKVRTSRSTRSLAALLGALLALTGCAVGPQYAKPPLQVNPNWSVPSGPQVSTPSAADNAWWKAFNDPTLEQLIQLAHGQNLPLQVAGLRILENRALLSIAIGNQYPQLQQAFATASGISLSENVANNQDFVRDFADVQLGFDVAWEADFWRKFGRGVKAQQASYMASVADYQNGLVSLSAEVARNYAAVRTFETLIEQTRRNVGVQQESLRIADARFRNGATSELDVSQARTLVEGTRASIPQLEISLAQAQNALSTLIGQPPGSVQALLEAPRPIPVAPAQIAVGIPAEVLRRRPDIRSAELVAMGQSERIGIAKADLYPRFALSGTIGLQSTTGSEPQSFNLLSPASLFAAFGPRVYWPFFNYGRIKNRVRAEDARFQQAIVGYQNSVIKASQEVEDGIVGFVKAIEAIAAQQSAVNAALRSVELSSAQYLDGAVDFQRVLDAERSQLQEENTLARLRSSLATNAISLYKALGGGWEMSVDQPFVSDPTRIEMQERTDWGDFFSTPPTISLPPTGPSEQPPPPSR